MKTHPLNYLAIAAVLATVLMPHTVLARDQSAFLGIPAHPSEAQCWTHSAGAVINNCAEVKGWCMPAVIDRSNSYFSAKVHAYGATVSNTIGCHVAGIGMDGIVASMSQEKYIQLHGSPQALLFDSIFVPSEGTLYACCNVNPGGKIISYHYW